MKKRLIAFVAGLTAALALGTYAQINGGGPNGGGGGGGGGTLTGMALSAPSSLFNVGGTPCTTGSCSMALSYVTNVAQNALLMGPVSGGPGTPTVRVLVGADVPAANLAGSGNGGVTGNLAVSHLNSGTGASSSTAWFGDGTWKVPTGAHTSYGSITTSLGSCALDTSTSNSDILNCFSGATGTFTVAFSAYAKPPVCALTAIGPNGSNPVIVNLSGSFTNTAVVLMYDGVSHALFSGGTFTLFCTGT